MPSRPRTLAHLAAPPAAPLAAPLAALLLSCDPLPPSPELTDGYKVFGIQANPPVARPNDKVTFTLYDHQPAEVGVLYAWSVCLYSYGAVTGYECVQPELQELSTEDSPRLTLDLGPSGLDLKRRLGTFKGVRDLNGDFPSLERGHDIYIFASSGLPGDQIGSKRTVKRLRVIDDGQPEGAPPLAENPGLEGWSIQPSTFAAPACERAPTGPLSPLTSDFLEVGRELLDAEISSSGEPCVVEAGATLDVSLLLKNPPRDGLYEWLTDEGSYASPHWTSEGPSGRFVLPNRSGPLELYFTVRDEAGGFSMGRQSLFLIPNKTTAAR